MVSVGNKGKFSDRLKRMKLIRYAKKMKLKVGQTIQLEEDTSKIKRKIVEGAAVCIAVGGAVVSSVVREENKINKSVENVKLKSNNDKKEDSVNKDISFRKDENFVNKAKGVDNFSNVEKKESTTEFIKRKAVETASVGAAVVGAVGVNLLGGSTQVAEPVEKSKSNDDKKFFDSDLKNEETKVDFGKDSKDSFQRVFKAGNDIIVIDKISDDDIAKGDRKTYLAAQIIKKIRREFEKKLNEIEVLESELYLLNEKNKDELDLEKCKEIKKEIQELISKINHIIEQYNIYQYNKFLDDMLDIDDTTLVDDISDFKRLYEGAEIQRRLVSDFELISEYQLLYSKLDDIKTNVEDVSRKNEDKIVDYGERDKKYENMKKQIINVDKFNEDCERYIDDQNKYIDDILKKVGKIDIDHITNYKLRGFGSLVSGTLKYLGMMAMSPFAAMLPGIAFRTYAANRMVNNLRSTLHLERVTSTIYKASDYQFELNNKINTLDYNYQAVDKTIDNVKKLKSEFLDQYQYDIPGYNETLRKINEIEVLVFNNKEKLNLIRNRLKVNKMINEQTLNKCRVLEKESRPYVERV